jgi:hypothetical protein
MPRRGARFSVPRGTSVPRTAGFQPPLAAPQKQTDPLPKIAERRQSSTHMFNCWMDQDIEIAVNLGAPWKATA